MILFFLLALLLASGLSRPMEDSFSFSLPVGGGGGTAFLLEGEGHITAVRAWERDGSYIYGIQLRFGYIWSKVAGRATGTRHEIELYPDERIIQLSGKYQSSTIYQILFVTSRGRFLGAGQPTSTSFNMYPRHPTAELRKLSGHFNSFLTSLAAHWGEVKSPTSLL